MQSLWHWSIQPEAYCFSSKYAENKYLERFFGLEKSQFKNSSRQWKKNEVVFPVSSPSTGFSVWGKKKKHPCSQQQASSPKRLHSSKQFAIFRTLYRNLYLWKFGYFLNWAEIILFTLDVLTLFTWAALSLISLGN